MRFLADESCDFAVVRALRAAGFDVVAVANIAPRLTDQAVVELALREHRIELTEDKDFGQARRTLPDALIDLVRKGDKHIAGRFAVVQPGRVRVRRLPGD